MKNFLFHLFWLLLLCLPAFISVYNHSSLETSNPNPSYHYDEVEEEFNQESTEIKRDDVNTITKANPFQKKVHLALMNSECAACHRSTLETSKEKALAIFDLDQKEKWYINLTEENLPGLEQRTQNSEDFTAEEKTAFMDFIKCQTSNDCG